MSETIADRMRKMTLEALGNAKSTREQKYENDVRKLFEYIMKDAEAKMEARASKGCFSSNIFEYPIGSYYYVNTDGEVVIIDEFKEIKGVYLQKIYKIVHSELFQRLLREAIANLGDMTVSCWYPGKNGINVITVKWSKLEDEAYKAPKKLNDTARLDDDATLGKPTETKPE